MPANIRYRHIRQQPPFESLIASIGIIRAKSLRLSEREQAYQQEIEPHHLEPPVFLPLETV
jgi:hypothetical protein